MHAISMDFKRNSSLEEIEAVQFAAIKLSQVSRFRVDFAGDLLTVNIWGKAEIKWKSSCQY